MLHIYIKSLTGSEGEYFEIFPMYFYAPIGRGRSS